MKRERLLRLIGEIEEDYVAEAYDGVDVPEKRGVSEAVLSEEGMRKKEMPQGKILREEMLPEGRMPEKAAQREALQKRELQNNSSAQKKMRGGARKWGIPCAAAACLCLVAGAVFVRRPLSPTIHENLSDGLLSGAFIKELTWEIIDLDLYVARVLTTAGGRVAEYQQITPRGIQRPNLPQLDTTTLLLSKILGEFYTEENGRRWYRMKDCDNIGMLISRDENGLLRQWKYTCFLVAEEPEERVEGFVYDADRYPDADLSAYTYGEVFSIVYGLESAADIESITAKAVQAGNTDTEKEIEKQVGEQTYVDRAQIESFYQAIVDVFCGEDVRDIPRKAEQYAYDFLQDKSTDGKKIYASRDLEIRLGDGTMIDNLRYDALRGYLYRRNAFSSQFLGEEVVGALNEIFGIQ